MRYLASIDYEHLDNGMFLTGLARAISRQEKTRPVILHSDSAYTERIMQTGVMRDEAQIRAQKDLNHRLIALFADEGVSAVGINGYQRKLIRLSNDELVLDKTQFNRLPDRSAIILSTLVWSEKKSSPVSISLPRMSKFIQKKLNIDKLIAFNKSDTELNDSGDKSWRSLSKAFKDEYLPDEFREFNSPLYLTTALNFQSLPEVKNTIFINS